MLHAYKVFLATAYPPPDLVKSMKRFLACLALCASLSASAQDDNCTILGVQELTLAYQELNTSIDSITNALLGVADSISSSLRPATIVEYTLCVGDNSNTTVSRNAMVNCVNERLTEGWQPLGGALRSGWITMQTMVKYADD